ncbi:MAG: fused MFS/spermidine synthase [Patescibacteria group bacterium]
MVVELASSRIIIPIIGSSVYTWTSMLGTIFFGLAIGNYIGGFLADKKLSKNILKLSLLLSSLSVSIVPFLSTKITYFLHLNQSLIFVSLFSSLALFLLPSVCIGLLYPMILKNHSDGFENIGRRYGSMSAFFTLGGVLGTFLTGFYLVGHIGSSNTFFIVSFVFFSLAALLDLEQKQNSKTTLAIIISFVALVSIIYFYNKVEKGNDKILFSSESDYYSIKVIKKIFGFTSVKTLSLDTDTHSMERTDGEDLPIYTNIYPLFGAINDKIKNVLIIGGGSYSMAKNISKFYPDSNVLVSEIDPEITMVAEKFFDLKKYPVKTSNTDGRFYLQKTTDKYDLIFGDAFNSFISIPWHMATLEFNKLLKSRLSDSGIYAINFIAPTIKQNDFLNSMVKTFKTVFDNSYVFTYDDAKGVAQNVVMVGVKSNYRLGNKELLGKIKFIKNGQDISLRLKEENYPKEWENGQILTDNFAPIERLSLSMINNYFQAYSRIK